MSTKARIRKLEKSTGVDGEQILVFTVRDGELTAEEFTPIVFVNDTLVAIGWRALESFK